MCFSVPSADSFSATATLMNWFRATPSLSETRRASSRSEVCSRSATLLFLVSSLNLLPRFWRRHGQDPETFAADLK